MSLTPFHRYTHASTVVREAFKQHLMENSHQYMPPDPNKLTMTRIAAAVRGYCNWVGAEFRRRSMTKPA